MSLLATRLTVLIGPSLPVPAPQSVLEALEEVEVCHGQDCPSGFQIRLRVGRGGPAELVDYSLLANPLLFKPFNRVILMVSLSGIPHLLMDGFITHQELSPGTRPGTGRLTVTGEDASVLMDMEERSAEHPAQDETIIVTKLLASYARHGVLPKVIPPLALDPPVPVERIPVQQCTDLAHLKAMAARHGHVFFVTPGPAPYTSTAYWGPPPRLGAPQKALSINLAGETNATLGSTAADSRGPELVEGTLQDRTSNRAFPVQSLASTRIPLAARPAWLEQQPNVRRTQLRASGLNLAQAMGRAQGRLDASTDRTVTVEGELDATRYGAILKPRGLVGVRGAGWSYDGFWYVEKVTHKIRVGEYKQSFTLAREGLGSTTPVVPP
jgi:hypothetical protein